MILLLTNNMTSTAFISLMKSLLKIVISSIFVFVASQAFAGHVCHQKKVDGCTEGDPCEAMEISLQD